jgi:hypothetical protein
MPTMTPEEQAEARNILDKAATQSARAKANSMEADPGPVGARDAKRLIREEKARRGEASPAGEEPQALQFEDFSDDAEKEDGEGAVGQGAVGVPDQFPLPKGMEFPEGWQVWFLHFDSRDTNTPKKGAPWVDPATGEPRCDPETGKVLLFRFCVLWNLSYTDEKRALRRAAGGALNVIEECSMAMIRSVDGHVADWLHDKGKDSTQQWWSEVGGKARHVIKSIYLRTHTMAPEESLRFFEQCATVRTVG